MCPQAAQNIGSHAENWGNRRKNPQEGILGQFFEADAPRRVFCKIGMQRVGIARRNKLLTSALSGKPKESAKEGLSEPSEGIFGRYFKIRGFRLSTPVAQKIKIKCITALEGTRQKLNSWGQKRSFSAKSFFEVIFLANCSLLTRA
jgi:hypothetical protein